MINSETQSKKVEHPNENRYQNALLVIIALILIFIFFAPTETKIRTCANWMF